METKATNITWQKTKVSHADRETLNGHRGAVLWFTGLSGSGKSSLAVAAEQALYRRGIHTYLLDGDNIRHGLNRNLGFCPEDRRENIRRIGEVAKLFADAGLIVLTAFISPYRADRDAVRRLIDPGRFIEIYVDCPIDICERRDPKGLYKRARRGEIKQFTGIDAPYEAPLHPELIVKTAEQTLEASVGRILDDIRRRGLTN
ncbi:MAG: adenylyl-sulfate kinase [Sporolactobacillus sp.]|nr:adenylyl-sulfate kinase [Sporolactobacillus sp.]